MHKLAMILCVMSALSRRSGRIAPVRKPPEHRTEKSTSRRPLHDPADGKPDLNGVWKTSRSFLLNAAPDLKLEDVQPWAAAWLCTNKARTIIAQ